MQYSSDQSQSLLNEVKVSTKCSRLWRSPLLSSQSLLNEVKVSTLRGVYRGMIQVAIPFKWGQSFYAAIDEMNIRTAESRNPF